MLIRSEHLPDRIGIIITQIHQLAKKVTNNDLIIHIFVLHL